jgi:hypothetical protein
MILKASQRGGGGELARHLLRTDENEHVEVYELRGFIADDVRGAFQEAYALSKGTRCRQFLFSLSLNPPQTAVVPDRAFKDAIRKVEQELGLTGQPRAIVFHEKEGRRHAHCVWSRIKSDTMTAVNLPHFKRKLRDISRDLYIKHDWRMPNGLANRDDRSPLTFTREQWQQAKRTGLDPRTAKKIFQDCWVSADTRAAFAHALESKGFWLAKGDRRGFVAVDFRGEIYSVARMVGTPTKTVAARLGDSDGLPSVEQTKSMIAARMTATVRDDIRTAERDFSRHCDRLALDRRDMARRQQSERKTLREAQEQRWIKETNERAARLAKGLRGLWQKLTGRYGKIRAENEREAHQAHIRDQSEKQALIQRHLEERRKLQAEIQREWDIYGQNMKALYRDVSQYVRMGSEQKQAVREQSRNATRAERPLPPIDLQKNRKQKRTTGGGRRRNKQV